MQNNNMQVQIQRAMNELRQKNPQGYQTISQMMKNNVNPEDVLKQWYGTANQSQKQSLFGVSRQWGCPDNILSQIQNFR